jgi:hypothetical protein
MKQLKKLNQKKNQLSLLQHQLMKHQLKKLNQKKNLLKNRLKKKRKNRSVFGKYFYIVS